jgi:flagellar hook-associated protein 1 FlgK
LVWSSPNSAPSPITVHSGTIGGLLGLQVTTLPAVQAQLDDIARALTVEFNAINVPIFYEPSVMPFNPANVSGYAGSIAVNPTVTASVIHDGAVPATNLVSGPALATGDTTFIDSAIALFNRTNVAFTAPGLPASGSIAQVATNFIAGQSAMRILLRARRYGGQGAEPESGWEVVPGRPWSCQKDISTRNGKP